MYQQYARDEYLALFLHRIEIPQEAQAYLLAAQRAIDAQPQTRDAFAREAVTFMGEPQTRIGDALTHAGEMAETLGYSPYTLHFLLLAQASYYLRKQYDAAGLDEALFWAMMSDLRCKLMECRQVFGIWGTFVAWWYKKIFSMDIFMLGRLQYERILYPRQEAYERAGVRVQWGDPVLSVHIPSAGPLREADCMDSYRRAFAFFSHDGRPLVCVCNTWLFLPAHEEILPPGSGILTFMRQYDVLDAKYDEARSDAWRIFGADAEKEPAQWPEDSGLRRAYKRHVLGGGKLGTGFGVMIFDGERIINGE